MPLAEVNSRLSHIERLTSEVIRSGQERYERIVRLEERMVAVNEALANHVEWEEKRYAVEASRQEERDKELVGAMKAIKSKMWFVVWGLLTFSLSTIGYFAEKGVPWVRRETFTRFIEVYEDDHPRVTLPQGFSVTPPGNGGNHQSP